MFPGTLIARLKQILTGSGGEGNDPPVDGQDGLLNGGRGYDVSRSMANARRLSEIADMSRSNHLYGSHSASTDIPDRQRPFHSPSVNRGAPDVRPVMKRNNNGPPNLIPIKYGLSRPSITQRDNGPTAYPDRGRSSGQIVPTLLPLPESSIAAVPELTSEFRNLLRTKYSTTPSSTSATPSTIGGHVSKLDRELAAQNEARKKYEVLMKKFIPIVNDPPVRGAFDRYTRKSLNGDIPRAMARKLSSVETYDLTDDDDNGNAEDDDDCVEVSPKTKTGRLFTTIDPSRFNVTDERLETENAAKAEEQSKPAPEIVNTVKERFQTKHVFRENIIQDVQQRYGALFSQRKSLIEQEKERLNSLKKSTQVQENEMRNKMLNYVCSFYTFDVLDETELKESTPEPEVVPLPELTREQLDQMHRKLRTGNQLVIEKFNLPITGNDLVTLQGMNWLNDAVINFYMELLRDRSAQKADQGMPKVYAMNTFFLPRLLQNGHAGVRRWTRKVDLLAHDMIVVPVHVSGIHWCMSTIDLRRKTIHYYDSMGSPNNDVLSALENYLCEESLDKRKQPFDTTGLTKQNIRECPRQKNGSDCGVFSCMFAEFLTRDHAITFDQSNMPYFRQKMTIEIMLGKLLT